MAGHRSTKKSSRQKRTSTEWRGWVYNYEEGRYENSKINSRGGKRGSPTFELLGPLKMLIP